MAKPSAPRGIRNNNPLNIRKGCNWRGEKREQSDSQFEQFESIEYGLRAAFILLRNYITGANSSGRQLNTIQKIVSRWAPPIENATKAYVEFVAGCSGINANQVIRFEDRRTMSNIVQAMAKVETGVTIPIEVIFSAYDLV